MKLKLGTRGSDLAVAQASMVAASLAEAGVETELVIITTAGDRSMAPSFGAIGPQGVFVREIEQALLDGEVDCAVHSYKDLPTKSPPGLIVAATPERIDVADFMLVHKKAMPRRSGELLPLHPKLRIGTSSARRRVWINHFRRDLVVEPLRGNVPTRIQRFKDGDFDAILLAGAGVRRLQIGSEKVSAMLAGIRMVRLDPDQFVPAPAQGALAVQCRSDDREIAAALERIDHPPSRRAVDVERAVLARAEGGCEIAFGAWCQRIETGFALYVMLEREGRVLGTRVEGAEAEPLAELAWNEIVADD